MVAAFATFLLYFVLTVSLSYFFSGARFWEVLLSERMVFSIQLSILVATVAMGLAMLLAIPTAYALSRYDFFGKTLIDTSLELPMIVSPAAIGAMLLIFFNTPLGEWDEPFSALHEAMRRELWLLLKTLQQQYGITILIVTHDMEEVFFLADSVTFIARGLVVQSGDKQPVCRCPNNVEAAKFFGVQNLISAEVVDIAADRAELFCPCLGRTLQVEIIGGF